MSRAVSGEGGHGGEGGLCGGRAVRRGGLNSEEEGSEERDMQ